MSLADFLTDKEWYDNSGLDEILSCPRKACYGQILSLESRVGVGADFGTCMHAAEAVYYFWWGKESEETRRLLAFREFSRVHNEMFTGEVRAGLDSKHDETTGLLILDHYFNTYLGEDPLLQPVEVELAGAIEMRPQDGDPCDFKPWWFTFRIDGIHRRKTYGDLWVREAKHVSGGVKREMLKLKLSRQPRGYVWAARQFPDVVVTGAIPDVVGVMSKTRECQRDYYPYPIANTNSWRRQTINIVENWRRMKARATKGDGVIDLDEYYQNTRECTAYGLCSFYDLCDEGVNPVTLSRFGPNLWNPLASVEAKIEVKRQVVQTPTAIKESIPL